MKKLPNLLGILLGKFFYLEAFFSVWSKFVCEKFKIYISGENLFFGGNFFRWGKS